ncbi:hypothetical protein [Embleya sp. NPDC001921]
MRDRAPLTPEQTRDLGNAVGRIAALTAMAINQKYPHHRLTDLTEVFMGENTRRFIAGRYVSALDKGMATEEAAADAGKALIRAWVHARRVVVTRSKPLTCGDAGEDVKFQADIHSKE